ncbi:MAG: M15 family metallopeptidase [Clostridia bacterium]|nr:M15 family metallopeptidase [Clostridia bacterium]
MDAYGSITAQSKGTCTVTVTSTDNPSLVCRVAVTVKEGEKPTYIDGILIANKTYALPRDYAPGIDQTALNHLWEMFAAAKKDGISLWICSDYRSWADQNYIYNGYVARDGQAAADRYSARPGHSEHQTGLAFDLNTTKNSFADTPEAKWIEKNCYKYGFILRYPKGKESATGYRYEPWHVRFVGRKNAEKIQKSGLCLEEYLGITSEYA